MNQRNRLIVNVMSNYAAFVVYGAVNFFLVWYSVKKIGAESFGLLSLILSLATVSDILVAGVCQALTKHLAADLSQNNTQRINELVNTSLMWFSVCGLLAFGALLTLAFTLERLFEVPAELLATGRWAMVLMALKTLIMFPFTTYQGTLWALQRYDLTNAARIVSNLFRVLAVVVYFEFVRPGILEIVIITMLGFFLERGMWAFFSFRLLPQIRLGVRYLSMPAMKLLLGFGVLLFVIYVANLLGYEAVKWVIGSKLSLVDVGGYTVIATLAEFAGSLVRAISNVLMPAASHLNAQGRQADLQRLAFVSTKYAMTLSTGLCIVPIFLLEPFLTLWVGKEYPPGYLHTLSICGIILLAGQWVITISVCLLQMMTGLGRIKIPAVITLTWAVLGLIIMWTSLHFWIPSLLNAVIIITIARLIGTILYLFYGFKVLTIKPTYFILKTTGLPLFLGSFICGFVLMLSRWVDFYNLKYFLITSIVSVLAYVVACGFFVLDANERYGAICRVRLLFRKII